MVARQLRASGIVDDRVLAALGKVPRHLFVPAGRRERAYDDTPLPIGLGQTISQPLMVATMLEVMELEGHERVLEVGAGCGYQAALLGELARDVFSVEVLPELAAIARHNLETLGYTRVTVVLGDGGLGYPAAAPYDAIVVAAAAPAVPAPLVEQLAPGGRLVIPVGGWMSQILHRVRKREDGSLRHERLMGCAFVPLVGKHGQ
jgi:protein-L-isoaspartate(D-aspartate) O-methyltransferase